MNTINIILYPNKSNISNGSSSMTFKPVCSHGEEKQDDDTPYFFVNTVHAVKKIRDHYMELFPGVNIRYLVGANLSGSSYMSVVDNIKHGNREFNRRDFILNSRIMPPYDPPPTRPIRNLEPFINGWIEEGETIIIPEDVPRPMYDRIVKRAEEESVFVGGVYRDWWNIHIPSVHR